MVNMFPKANSIGGVSPKELLTGVKIDYKKDCKLMFDEYVQVYAEHDIAMLPYQWKQLEIFKENSS